ncbi:hypothetical protein E2C01_030366 [Portunus trituberculatus]|uniref:Uncharacterized protein n=1 Tax=Portunus trituberculatus TaxID=210409 RepID=A0A5B7EUK1_PORTR|nr:hypothetical protein [Portunus trituberculatus]
MVPASHPSSLLLLHHLPPLAKKSVIKGPNYALCPVSLSIPVISLFHLIGTHRVNDMTAQFIPLINAMMRETVFSHVI